MTTIQKIKEIEDEMARTQKNKATSYHLGQLKAKLAKLRRELLAPSGGGGGAGGIGFDVARTGVASVGFVGFPSVGKSTLMSKLTGTHSEVSEIDFTTLTTVPGTLRVHGAPIQILDLPGIIEGANDGRGRGRQVIAGTLFSFRLFLVCERNSWQPSVARTCNLIFIVLDVLKPLNDKRLIETELEGFGIRLNKKPPNITVRKKDKGGIAITNTVPLTNIDHDEIKAILSEYRISNGDVAIREPNATADDIVDVIEGNRVYIPCIYVLNKIDAISIEELDLLYKIPNSVPISSKEWLNIDELIEVMWQNLDLVRVYTKPRGQPPDYTQPVVLKRGKSTVEDFCNSIHKEIAKQLKYAIVWGSSAKHARGQKVGLEHILQDEDVVHIVKK
ncbi:RBG1 [Sanghuangporus weigelae]